MQKASNAVVHNVVAESGNEREGGVDFLRGPAAAGPGAELAGRKCHARKEGRQGIISTSTLVKRQQVSPRMMSA